jgi:2-polyprenyl-3-methyl-5-hydroxy-6-metoxy-1,4-benzoquinol methylase
MNQEEKEAIKKYSIVGEHFHNWRTKLNPKGWIYNEFLEMPATFELMGNIKGKEVLDIGCGPGIYAKKMAKIGARVKGFDITPKMIEIAKREYPELDLRIGSVYNIPFDEKFDIAIAPLVIEHLEDWNKVFREVNKVLKKGGCFIFSIGNPVFDITKRTNKSKPFIREFENYFKEKKRYSTWRDIFYKKHVRDVRMTYYHKTYETVIKTIISNGFEIIDYKDCFPSKESKRLFPKEYNILSKVPFFCVWKVKKK